MKIAVVTDDGATVCAHFGRARYFLVATVEDGKISNREMRPKTGHHDFIDGPQEVAEEGDPHSHNHEHQHPEGHGRDPAARTRHTRMFATITDCSMVLARGMGAGAYEGLQEAGTRPVVPTALTTDEALSAYVEGRLEDHPEKLH
ncbi:MAG: dinitrogenase iron-molybdenum cofactor biosynthesis protein [Anaerolineales bacterium]|nr:dinitrogenase iron-molybdenum cofactor biosynthesis protein [Anaerolineales bacterium]